MMLAFGVVFVVFAIVTGAYVIYLVVINATGTQSTGLGALSAMAVGFGYVGANLLNGLKSKGKVEEDDDE